MKKIELEKQLESYYEDCKFRKRLNEKTIKAYTIDLNQYLEFITTTEINQKIINEYIHYLNKKYLKYKTIKRKIASVKAFYSYLEYEEIIDYSPFNKIKTKIKEPKLLPKTIQKDYIDKIIHLLLKDLKNSKTEFQKKISLRNITLISVMFSTGIRVSELCNIKLKDIDLLEKKLKIFGKGSKERILYLGNSNVVQLCQMYLTYNNTCKKNEYFFLNKFNKKLSEQTVRILLKKIESELELSTHITPHMFRHTFATTLLEKGVDIRYIQNILGHSSISTTQIYTYVTYSKQKEILTNKNPINDYQLNI
ncbi:tyrosine-type recombinase/integrase [Faecalibacillus sp. TM498]|uniref:tyrosine-type recombinase/integrase n=1 Tax=Faecalibacillus sp. TM498 TaxID=2884904 RepID=UPI001D0A8520|nr:tyrosine-type recombinase/integrase [Faecalibacillus sp. TM498]MCB8541214.1 tyrosine-type recombinase/integrase [Faecalibacillus sp. TM498]